jgi:AraC-like DNA-binding protein
VIAATVKALREMAARDFRPTQVTFTLARNSELPEFERFFGCPVEFSVSADQFGLSNETLAMPLVTEDHHLQYLKEHSLSVPQIAWVLGFEGPTSFNYAFGRWTGWSASEARKEQQRSKV